MKKLINKLVDILFTNKHKLEEENRFVTAYDIGKVIYYLKREIRHDIMEVKSCKFGFYRYKLKGRIEANKEILAKLENIK